MVNHDRQSPSDVLATVRALLAKAESTPFDAEAEALTAKAQELMARHRIEQAMLDAGGRTDRHQPMSCQIRIDDPYADAKALLLATVAEANGCRTVWSKALRCATVFGFAGELAGVELLFTSLLVQSAAAVHRAGPRYDRYGRSRTTRFRRSFLIAFAVRVGERLRSAVDAMVDDEREATGTELVPLFARREAEVEAVARAAFPRTRRMSASVSDADGWHAGTAFGDQADLGTVRRGRLRA
ncbi:MAG: DUF2786 domain-containing protein [Acidimicrobiia bacterium]|jgi:hypothetical protein